MNNENLKTPTASEARERGRKGGIASGKSRQQKRAIHDALEKALTGKFTDVDGKKLSGFDAIAVSMVTAARGGNVQAFIAIRDTLGEKPVDQVDLNTSQDTLEAYQKAAEMLKGG